MSLVIYTYGNFILSGKLYRYYESNIKVIKVEGQKFTSIYKKSKIPYCIKTSASICFSFTILENLSVCIKCTYYTPKQ